MYRILQTTGIAMLVGAMHLGYTPATHAALNCDASNQSSFTWDDAGRDWPAPTGTGASFNPTLAHTETVDGIDFNFTFSSDQSNADFVNSLSLSSVPAPNDTVAGVGADLDGDGALDEGLALIVDPRADIGGAPLDMDVFLDVTLSLPISEFEFFVTDVDEGIPSRRDKVTVTGALGATPVLPVASHFPGAVNVTTALVGNVATTIEGVGQRFPNTNPEEAVVVFSFASPIDSFQVIYADDEDDDPVPDIGVVRGISIMSNFGFCPSPDLQITKTDSPPNLANSVYTPGVPFSYDIVVTNTGPGSSNGAIFNDSLPAWAQPTPPATSVEWSCVAAGGAACPAGTIDGVNDVIPTLPDGGTVTFTVSGTYSPDMVDYL